MGGMEPWQPGPRGLCSWPGATLLANQSPVLGPSASICRMRLFSILSIWAGGGWVVVVVLAIAA